MKFLTSKYNFYNLSSRSTHPGSSINSNSGFRLSGRNDRRNSFTLIELLVVLALVAILSVVVVMTLNPAELLKQARDSNRLSDLATINTALNLFSTDVTSGFMGTSTIVYVSIPSSSPTCTGVGLPTLPTGYTYNCVTSQNLRNTDGTGWIPVNFNRISSNSPMSQLPTDPTNTTSTKYYTYITGGSWKVMATPESVKYIATAGADGGSNIGQFEIGNNMNLAPFTDGLVGWWKFDEGGGAAAVDSSGYENNGVASGTTIVGGKVGIGARSFNGTSDCITATNVGNFNHDKGHTLSAWISISSGTYLSFGLPYLKDTGPNYAIRKSLVQTNLADTKYFSFGWRHVVGTYDLKEQKLYLDGILIKSQSAEGSDSFGTNTLYMGAHQGCSSYKMTGSLDDVRIYNRALSAAEVLALYNATK